MDVLGAAADGVERTVVSSAPATDAITQTQIALNNLLDQVRETLLFLLEGAPPLSHSDEFVKDPDDTLSKWKTYRNEFEEKWRTGRTAAQRQQQEAPESSADSGDEDGSTEAGKAEELADDLVNMSSFVPPTLGPESLEAVKNDTLFRTQRIAAIAQSIRSLVPSLPSTLLTDGQYVADPHESELLAAEISFWQQANEDIEPILEAHHSALKNCLQQIDKSTGQVALSIIDQGAT